MPESVEIDADPAIAPDGFGCVYDATIDAGAPWSRVIPDGQILRLVDIHGSQAIDFLCYADADRAERYHVPNTLKAAGTAALTRGHCLYSDLARPLFEIVADTFVGHDTLGGCCSAPSNQMLYGVEGVPCCRENFLTALDSHGMGRRDVVPNVNFFMEFPVSAASGAAIAHGRSRPGERVDLRARTDVLAVISNCPQVHNPCNAYNPTPVRALVFAPTAVG
jgi:urea carboxylase-associated protein 1